MKLVVVEAVVKEVVVEVIDHAAHLRHGHALLPLEKEQLHDVTMIYVFHPLWFFNLQIYTISLYFPNYCPLLL